MHSTDEIIFKSYIPVLLTSPVSQQETQGQSLVPEDPLEKEMATHSIKIPWTQQSGHKESDTTEHISTHILYVLTGS